MSNARKAKCHRCGLVAPRDEFVCGQGNGDQYWLMFHCPQCSADPLLTDADARPSEIPHGFRNRCWDVTVSDAMRVETYTVDKDGKESGRSSNHIHSLHPFYQREGMKDLDRHAKLDYKARCEGFREESRKLTGAAMNVHSDEMDALRRKYGVGPHETKTVLFSHRPEC